VSFSNLNFRFLVKKDHKNAEILVNEFEDFKRTPTLHLAKFLVKACEFENVQIFDKLREDYSEILARDTSLLDVRF
jgi:hypothetical protein